LQKKDVFDLEPYLHPVFRRCHFPIPAATTASPKRPTYGKRTFCHLQHALFPSFSQTANSSVLPHWSGPLTSSNGWMETTRRSLMQKSMGGGWPCYPGGNRPTHFNFPAFWVPRKLLLPDKPQLSRSTSLMVHCELDGRKIRSTLTSSNQSRIPQCLIISPQQCDTVGKNFQVFPPSVLFGGTASLHPGPTDFRRIAAFGDPKKNDSTSRTHLRKSEHEPRMSKVF
jgi:hypothetical protein